MVAVDLVTGLSPLTWQGASLPIHPLLAALTPPMSHHHTLLHIPLSPAGKEQNAGVIKDNELLISTGKHN